MTDVMALVKWDLGPGNSVRMRDVFYAEQKAILDGRLPLIMVQRKYDPSTPFDYTTGENYLEHLAIAMQVTPLTSQMRC